MTHGKKKNIASHDDKDHVVFGGSLFVFVVQVSTKKMHRSVPMGLSLKPCIARFETSTSIKVFVLLFECSSRVVRRSRLPGKNRDRMCQNDVLILAFYSGDLLFLRS